MTTQNIENKELKCPNCKSNKLIKRGQRKTQNRGLIQRYGCKDCSHRFVQDNGFFRMRNSPQKITLCLDLFYKGISTRQVQQHLQTFYPANSSWVTIYKWILKYSEQISEFTKGLKLKVGSEIQVDEMSYTRRKYPKRKGVDNNWFIDVIDCETRFMVASNFVKSRGQNEIKEVLKRAKYKTDKQIKVVTTDGFFAYPRIVKRIFGYHNFTRKDIEHNVVTQLKGEGFNIMIERLHNNIRQRTKTFRGFHGSIKSANSIMKGYEVYYNFITKHQAINCCPYELATDLKLNSENKWLELIEKSKSINISED